MGAPTWSTACRTVLAAMAAACVGGACSSSTPAAVPTTTTVVVRPEALAPDDLGARVCDASGLGPMREAPVVHLADLDGDGSDEAAVSTRCGATTTATNGVFTAGPGAPTLVGTFPGDELSVATGAGVTLAAVVPLTVVTGDGRGRDRPGGAADGGGDPSELVERVVYELGAGGLRLAERRQLSRREYEATFHPDRAPGDLADRVERWQTGVGLVEPVTCAGTGRHGSGFLVAGDRLVTNAHVVTEAVVVRVEIAGRVVEGLVLGQDPVRDIALLGLSEAVPGHVFELSRQQPRIGTEAYVLGYPLVRQFSMARGEISGIGRRFEVAGSFNEDAIQTSAPLNPGNSGGPLVDPDGVALGINSARLDGAENVAFTIPASLVADTIGRWRAAQANPPAIPEGCATGNHAIASSTVSVDLPPVLASLTAYIDGVNSGNHRQAWDINAASRRGADFEAFRAGLETSTVHGFRIDGVERVDERTLLVDTSFVSTQSPEHGRNGQTCTVWDLRYTMARYDDGVWRIESTEPLATPGAC